MTSKINIKKESVKKASRNMEDVVQNLSKIKFNYDKNNYQNIYINNLNKYILDTLNLYEEILKVEKKVNNRAEKKLKDLLVKLKKLDIKNANDNSIKGKLKKTKLDSKLSKTKKLKITKNKYDKLVELVGRTKANRFMKQLGIKVIITNDIVSLAYVKNKNTNAKSSKKVKSITSSSPLKGNNINKSKAKKLKYMGVIYYNGHKETWYSQKVRPGGGLTIPGRHVASDGTIRDKNNYICVAANPKFLKKGSIVKTTLGMAKVYDSGCAYGTIDVYTNW